MTKIFFVTSHGTAGDRFFEWLPRAVKMHPDIFVYMGESVRSKYFKERDRGARPSIDSYEVFLSDLAGGYLFAGEFYSYRAYNFQQRNPKFRDTQQVNIIRDPIIWLSYYVKWRLLNCNLPQGNLSAIEHEWNVVDHDDLRRYGFQYQKKDVERWSFLRGVQILNKMISDDRFDNINFRLEQLYIDYDRFMSFMKSITSKTIVFTESDFKRSKEFFHNRTGFQERYLLREDLKNPIFGWKREAIDTLLSARSRAFFDKEGYEPI